MRFVFVVVALLLAPVGLAAQGRDGAADRDQLRRIHAELITAHIERNVDGWMAIESDSFVSVNGGEVTFPGARERRAQRTTYLQRTSFTTYRDLREPIIRISDDGSLGWLIAEVEIVGSRPGEDGGRASFRDVWAWIELYEKSDAGWRLVGNASNRR